MAKQLIQYEAEDGKVFSTLEAAEHHERVVSLAAELAPFDGEYAEDAFDLEAAAVYLLTYYKMEHK